MSVLYIFINKFFNSNLSYTNLYIMKACCLRIILIIYSYFMVFSFKLWLLEKIDNVYVKKSAIWFSISSNLIIWQRRRVKTFALARADDQLSNQHAEDDTPSSVSEIRIKKTRSVLNAHWPSTNKPYAVSSKQIWLKQHANWPLNSIPQKTPSIVNSIKKNKRSYTNSTKCKKIGELTSAYKNSAAVAD